MNYGVRLENQMLKDDKNVHTKSLIHFKIAKE
jgi:hypothetical protein